MNCFLASSLCLYRNVNWQLPGHRVPVLTLVSKPSTGDLPLPPFPPLQNKEEESAPLPLPGLTRSSPTSWKAVATAAMELPSLFIGFCAKSTGRRVRRAGFQSDSVTCTPQLLCPRLYTTQVVLSHLQGPRGHQESMTL